MFDLKITGTGNIKLMMQHRLEATQGGMRKAADIAGREIKGRWRKAVIGGGLGARLANSIRDEVYPRAGKNTLHPSVLVFSRAPKLMRAYGEGATIQRNNGGVFLWIPTENVPRRRGGAMTPSQVEEAYTDFEYIPSPSRPGVFLAVVSAVHAQNKRGYRKASQKRIKEGREVIPIIMFILVRQVRLKKRYDFAALERQAMALWPEVVSHTLNQTLRKF